MPVHLPSESGLPAETPHGRSNGRIPDSVRLGFFFRDAKSRCRPELHRSGRGGSTPPSRLQTLTVKSRLLTGENSVRIRVDPPFRPCGSAATAAVSQTTGRICPTRVRVSRACCSNDLTLLSVFPFRISCHYFRATKGPDLFLCTSWLQGLFSGEVPARTGVSPRS
jgi:hypothetical protein